jgi:hypothetical protein
MKMMMMSMLRSPPKDAFLGAALGEQCKDELKHPALLSKIDARSSDAPRVDQ